MKTTKKILALIVVMMMVLGMSAVVFAQEKSVGNGPATITIQNTTPTYEYSVKKAFDAAADASGNISYFKLKADGTRITAVADMPNGFDTYFALDAAGNITAKDAALKEGSTSELSDDAIAWLTANSTLVTDSTVTANTDGSLKYTGLEYGYYVVTSTLGEGLVTVTSTNPNATVVDKNQDSSWDEGKKIVIVDENGNETLVDTVDLSIGEELTFRVTINAVNYEGTKQVKQYTISDDMPEGLTFGGITKVTVTESNDTEHDLTSTYTSTTADTDGKFSIVIPWADEGNDGAWTSKYTASSTITVEYKATLNDKATIAGSGNENKATFKPTYTDGTEPEGEKPDSTTKVYTTSLTIKKVDENGAALTGAEFTITGDGVVMVVTTGDVFVEDSEGTYYLLTDGTYTTTAPSESTASRYASTTTKYKKEQKVTLDTTQSNVNATAFVNEEGKVVFAGLSAGTYTIEETVVPTGYNKAADITFVITATVNDDKTVTYTATKDGTTVAASNNTFEISVENKKGSVLPSTGGVGTTMIYVVGTLLVLIAGVVLISKRRVGSR